MSKVLIIDDERSIRESLSSILADEGFTVSCAVDGREGLEFFRQERPEIVLLDVWLPELDGIEILKEIRRQDQEVVVVVISGHGTISTAVEAVKMGANDFLEKPLSIDKVLEVISRGLQKGPAGRTPENGFKIGVVRGPDTWSQKTIGKSIVVYGVGLFSGVKTGMVLLPMPPDTGVIFEHVPDGERIPAFIDYVYSAGYSSSIRGKNCVVRTVEHLMSTLHMYGITNLLIKISEEVPIFDGSALEICRKIDEAGVVEQNGGIEPLRVKQAVALSGLRDGKALSIEPAETLRIDYFLDYPRPIGVQTYHFSGGLDTYLSAIAPCRTFGFVKDFEMLEKMGLGAGGRVSNFIMLNEDGVLNTELRFEDEFVRHKVLDLIGDLYLLGRPVVGKVTARQTGHLENIALVKELQRLYTRKEER